jgi:uncharacterized repeat protein (TIGR03837 family)
MNKPVSCDLFCTVVDNFGDAGVAWRLARQLAGEFGWQMRLWIDDLAPLARLRPGIDPALDQQLVDAVSIRRWAVPFPAVTPAQVVIEAFACELPAGYVDAMAQRPPVWINLEYLSAESWVSGSRSMASRHPSLPLVKHSSFPATVGTGGLIRESDACFSGTKKSADLTVSLFCYDNPALSPLLDRWADGDEPVRCLVADSLPRQGAAAWAAAEFPVGGEIRRGALTLTAMPFLPQPEYDRLLGACDLNFVRGEDSFVRAQWAQRPFVWQIYPRRKTPTTTQSLSGLCDRPGRGYRRGRRQLLARMERRQRSGGGLACHATGAASAGRTRPELGRKDRFTRLSC